MGFLGILVDEFPHAKERPVDAPSRAGLSAAGREGGFLLLEDYAREPFS